MAAKTGISWTDRTWSPLVGCSKVSPGCANCYAVKEVRRLAGNPHPKIAQDFAGLVERHGNGQLDWTGMVRFLGDRLFQPLTWKDPQRVFVNSMSDLFHEDVPDETLDQLFVIMALADQHIFQVLTKRPARMAAYLNNPTLLDRLRAVRLMDTKGRLSHVGKVFGTTRAMWPIKHVHLGVSVENQATADKRIPWLLRTPALVRFISYEPALGPLDLYRGGWNWLERLRRPTGGYTEKLNWVIVGGESGPKARPCDVHWLCDVAKQCQSWGVACWMKQDSARRSGQQGRIPDEVWAMKELPQGL